MRRIFADAPLTSAQKNQRDYARNKKKRLERNKQYHQDNKDVIRIRHRNNRHHISQEWYDHKITEQENKCAICNDIFIDTPHIDHNHGHCKKNGSCDICRRDLLCTDCNLGLGRFHDSKERLSNAIQYLEKHNGNR